MSRAAMWALLSALLAGLLLAGCSQRQHQPTLASLPTAPGEDAPAPVADLERSRERAISVYAELLAADNLPAEMHAETLRRLADLRLERLEARQADNPARAPEAGRVEAEQTIALYEARLREYPGHPGNDQVLYQLSRAYEHGGQPEAALDALNRLAAAYPGSILIAETQFRRGETLFMERDFAAAGAAYRAVLEQGEHSGFHAQALYKLGWSLFRQERFEQSVDTFLALIDHERADGSTGAEEMSTAGRERVEDSLRAISLAFNHLGGPAAITDYFHHRGHRPDEHLIYGTLAERYLEQERYSDAAASYQAFVSVHPLDDHAPAMQLRVIDGYRQGGFSGEMLAAKRRYAELFDLAGPYWQEHDPDTAPAAVAALEHNISVLARHAHAGFQEAAAAADFSEAEHWYRRYLDNFPDGPGSQEMHFLYAELLFEGERFADAAQAYEQTAYRYDPGPRAAEAGYAALLAYEAHAERLEGDAETTRQWERLSLTSAQRFTRAFPDHPEAVSVLGLSIDRWFRLDETAAAEEASRRLLDRYPEADPQAKLTAWVVLGHITFDRADYLQAEAAYQQVLASPVLAEEQRADFVERLAAAVYRQGEVARDEGDIAAAVDHFLRVPESRVRAVAIYDAAHLLAAQEDWLAAATVLEDFRRDYPDHALQSEATRTLAVAYASSSQPARAATEFLRISDASDDPEERREALLQAAELYLKAGQAGDEASVLVTYVDSFPSPLNPAMDARQRLAELADLRGDDSQRRHWRHAMVQADARAGSARTDRSRYLAATASLALAEESLAAYRQVRLVEPLERSVREKRRRMDVALEALEQAGSYRLADVTTAATHHTGAVYAEFAEALLESERPRGLDELALEEYEMLLEEQAYPFEEKAIELFELNAARASQGRYDHWVRQSFEQLAELMPVRYARTERNPRFVDALR